MNSQNILIQVSSNRKYHILLLNDENEIITVLDSFKTFDGAKNTTIRRYTSKFMVNMEVDNNWDMELIK